MRKIPVSPWVGVSLQDGIQEEPHGKTKQESAWLFRLWYTFDHKYPFYSRLCTKHQKVFFISHFNATRSGKCSSSCFHSSQMWRLWGFGTRTTCMDQLNVLACSNSLWIESVVTGHPPISCHSGQQSAPRVLDCLCGWAAALGRWTLSPPATRARTPHETASGHPLASAGWLWLIPAHKSISIMFI